MENWAARYNQETDRDRYVEMEQKLKPIALSKMRSYMEQFLKDTNKPQHAHIEADTVFV